MNGALHDGLRPELTGTLALNFEASFVVVLSNLFVLIAAVMVVSGVAVLLTGGTAGLGWTAMACFWAVFAPALWVIASRDIATGARRLLASLDEALGWPVELVSQPGEAHAPRAGS